MGRVVDRWRQDVADRTKELTPFGARRALVKARMAVRGRTVRWRSLPDVLIIGAQRCGTSSLYKWLGRHPNVVPSLRKEVEYFSVDYAKGEGWYRLHFPMAVRRRAADMRGRRFVTFEDSPDYLFNPRAPERARALVPHAKLIVLLRDPAARAISHYYLNVRIDHEPLDLEAALRAEDDRLGQGWPAACGPGDDREYAMRTFSYVARGRYAEQLDRWFAVFPRHQFLVLRSEDLFARPEATYGCILDFLELPRWEPPEFRNYTDYDALDGRYPEPPDTVREFLADRFVEPNRRLVDLLGGEFRWDAMATR
jgi:Sulfotransferase domain